MWTACLVSRLTRNLITLPCADYADINKALIEFQEVAGHVNESMRRADEMCVPSHHSLPALTHARPLLLIAHAVRRSSRSNTSLDRSTLYVCLLLRACCALSHHPRVLRS
jgi:hypothetical protein